MEILCEVSGTTIPENTLIHGKSRGRRAKTKARTISKPPEEFQSLQSHGYALTGTTGDQRFPINWTSVLPADCGMIFANITWLVSPRLVRSRVVIVSVFQYTNQITELRMMPTTLGVPSISVPYKDLSEKDDVE